MILLDTHVLVWWLALPQRLSATASREIQQAFETNALKVSAISCWEIALLVAKGRLSFDIDGPTWIRRAAALPMIEIVPVDLEISIRAVHLPGELHPDPADRILAATALERGWPLVTQDERLLNCSFLKTIW